MLESCGDMLQDDLGLVLGIGTGYWGVDEGDRELVG